MPFKLLVKESCYNQGSRLVKSAGQDVWRQLAGQVGWSSRLVKPAGEVGWSRRLAMPFKLLVKEFCYNQGSQLVKSAGQVGWSRHLAMPFKLLVKESCYNQGSRLVKTFGDILQVNRWLIKAVGTLVLSFTLFTVCHCSEIVLGAALLTIKVMAHQEM
ncbi:hypothetical protein MPSEU_001037100 [Mayamaea pseudoterrestris]|nr:hypothetical protein MPSEU_001037100 [Mayamaea pseudoterrestris]